MLCNVQMILFFDIYSLIKLTRNCQIDDDFTHMDQTGSQTGAISSDKEVQTDLHPIPSNKDSSYVWNLWDLRRKAIELVNPNRLIPKFAKHLEKFTGKSSTQKDNFGPNYVQLSQTRHCKSTTRE